MGEMAKNGEVIVPVAALEHNVAPQLSLVQSFLSAHPDVRFIRYYLLDYSNILRTRFTTTARALQIASQPNGGLTTGSPILSVALQGGGVHKEMFRQGEDLWKPDWSTLRDFVASKGTATVMCWLEEPSSRKSDKPEEKMLECPRTLLTRVLADVKAKHDVDFLVGFEIEFTLIKDSNATEPLPSPGILNFSGVWSSNTLRTPHWKDIVEESVSMLESAGVHVWTFCTEGAQSKYEISLSPLPPLEAIDAMHFSHEIIKTLAHQHGCYATMHAKPFEVGPTNGKHVHMSLSRPEMGTPFLAGVMKHFRPLCGLMLPNMESYHREGQFGGGGVCWGWSNKLTCMRRLQDAYFELRPTDHFANMYLTLAALIGVGMQGVADNEELVPLSLDKVYTEGGLTEEMKKEFKIVNDVPKDLGESLAELKKSELIKSILGDKLFDMYMMNKEKDWDLSKKMSSAERRKALLEQF